MNQKKKLINSVISLDTETTNLDYKIAKIIEFGCAYLDNDNLVHRSILINPEIKIEPEISAITNISNKMVENCHIFEDARSEIESLIKLKTACVAHNAFYDQNVLKYHNIGNLQFICTLRLAKKLLGDDITVKQFNLPYLRYRFDILDPADNNHLAHRADSDALVALHLFLILVEIMESRSLLDENEDYLTQIISWLEEPIIVNKMPFGRHKDKEFKDVPMSYWNWALGNLDCLKEDHDLYDKDLALSIEQYLTSKLYD